MERFYGLDLKRVDSLTKYPSILTYHTLGERGCVTENVQVPFDDGDLFASEKINGANARVIFSPLNDFIIGSRKELLYAKDDFIPNPALEIVAALKDWAYRQAIHYVGRETDREFRTYYFEVFGGSITKHKEYTGSHQMGFRLLDVMTVNLNEIKEMSLEQISGAREDSSRSFQKWLYYSAFCFGAKELGVEIPPQIQIDSLPVGVENTLTFLESLLPKTKVALDDKALGNAEGIVIRNSTRSIIAKLKFREYRRTMAKR